MQARWKPRSTQGVDVQLERPRGMEIRQGILKTPLAGQESQARLTPHAAFDTFFLQYLPYDRLRPADRFLISPSQQSECALSQRQVFFLRLSGLLRKADRSVDEG